MVRVAALMLVAAAGWAQQTLEITSALYGADNTWLDVSARLRSLVRNNTLDIRVDIGVRRRGTPLLRECTRRQTNELTPIDQVSPSRQSDTRIRVSRDQWL